MILYLYIAVFLIESFNYVKKDEFFLYKDIGIRLNYNNKQKQCHTLTLVYHFYF